MLPAVIKQQRDPVTMTTTAIDLQTYCRRIGYKGRLSAEPDTVKALVVRHTHAISFENLNPFLGWPVDISLAAVERKLVHGGRGGYCYEQNTLFRAVLESLDIAVTGLAARVLWQRPAGTTPAQSHMMLRAEIEGIPYLVDVGFGIQTPTWPLRLDTEKPQTTPHGRYRILQGGDEYWVEVEISGEWKPIYSFDLQEQSAGDYKMFNWYCSTHPDSHFTTDLIATRPTTGGRYTLRNNNLIFYPHSGPKRESALASVNELRDVLLQTFDINLAQTPETERGLEKVFTSGK